MNIVEHERSTFGSHKNHVASYGFSFCGTCYCYFVLALILFLQLFSVSGRAQVSTNLSQQGWYADPEAHIFAGEYWIFPTASNFGPNTKQDQTFSPLQQALRSKHIVNQEYLLQTYLDALSSPDLVHWTRHPDVLDVKNISWAAYAVWAPTAIHLNGKYYLFFAANDIQKNEKGPGGIGVAVSENPGGPFVDAIGKPLIGEFHNGAQPIDPMVFKDDDGSIYIYYGGQGHCNVARLAADLKSVIPMKDGEMYKEITPEHYVEGPFMIKRKGTYYFMWSEGYWGDSSYGVAYAKSSSPTGPFERVGKILQTDPGIATGPGHHSVVQIPGTDDWYIVYHRHPLGTTGANQRRLAIDAMYFDANGDIQPVKMSKEGPLPRLLTKVAIEKAGQSLPRIDLHVHIDSDEHPEESLKPAQATAISRQMDVRFGVLAEGGCQGEIHDNASLEAFLAAMKDQPMWAGLQVYGFDWQKCLSAENLARLDYISADALVMPDTNGKATLLWQPGVRYEDPENFMDRYVDYNLRVLSQPIQVWANPTYLPESLQSRYDELWTPARMDRVIQAAVQNHVAIEINSHFHVPSVKFLKRAKAAGARFTLGSNAHVRGIGNIDFPLQAARQAGLTADDIFVPKRQLSE